MTPEARTGRERKQKIFVVVAGLFLVALLAIQLPKLLGGSSSSSAAPTETTDLSGAPAAAPTTTATATPTSLVAAGTSPSPQTTKLRSFSRFSAKDPFVQQVKAENEPETAATAEAGKPAAAAGAEKPAGEKQAAAAPPSRSFTTVKPAKAPAVTIVTVNGTRQILATGMKFPAADPLFVLVAEKQSAKSVVIGVAGGAYAGGSKTTTLRVGRSVTLVNTATGARYEISLVSVGSGEAVAKPVPGAKTP